MRLERFKAGGVDYDIILPYYTVFNNTSELNFQDTDEQFSGSDYQQTTSINGVKADIRIDPKQRYEVVSYKGFDYRVASIFDILEAKVKYAKTKGGQKHRSDILEMILKTK